MTEAERAAVRSRPFAAPACQPILERLEWKAWSIILWGLDAGDPKVIRLYLDTFRRMPDGSVRARPLPRIEPLRVKPVRPPTLAKLQAQDRRRATEAARALAAEAIVADIHERGADTYAALAAVLPAWRQPRKRPNHRGLRGHGGRRRITTERTAFQPPTQKHRSYRSYRSYRSDAPGRPVSPRPAPCGGTARCGSRRRGPPPRAGPRPRCARRPGRPPGPGPPASRRS